MAVAFAAVMSAGSSERMLFATRCIDKVGSAAVRAKSRVAHLEWIRDHVDHFLFAGPLRDVPHGPTVGSLLITQHPPSAGIESVETILKDDPYVKAGLFQSSETMPWRCGMRSDTLPDHLYAVWCVDKMDSMTLRKDTRERHLDWWRDGGRKGMIGPFPQGDGAVGTLIVCEGESLDEVKQWAKGDPYAQVGLFERVHVCGVSMIVLDGKMLLEV